MDRIREQIKAILTTDMTGGTKGGLLLAEQANRFIDLTLDYSAMLGQIRVERKRRQTGEVDTLNVGSVVTEGATEAPGDGSSPAEEVKPTFGKIEYTMKKLRSMFDITTESLIDNVEGESAGVRQAGDDKTGTPTNDFRTTLMNAYAKRIATDFEYLAIQGDTSLAATTKTNRLLRTNQGWDIITDTGTNLVDAGHLGVSGDLFAAMLESMPAPYTRRMTDLRWFIGFKSHVRWQRKITTRQTGLGDAFLQGATPTPHGIPMIVVPLIPEGKSSTVGTTVYTNETFIWLTFPENFIWFVRREMESYWEFKPRGDKWENTTYSETDMAVEEPNAIVKATNVKWDAATDYSM